MAGGQSIEDLTRRAFGLWNAREFDALLEMLEEDGVWDVTPAGIPDMGEYRGRSAIRRWFDQWLEIFPDSEILVEKVEERGSWGFATVVQHVTGGASGAPVPFYYYGIGHWPEGRMRYVINFTDPEAALETFRHYTESPLPVA